MSSRFLASEMPERIRHMQRPVLPNSVIDLRLGLQQCLNIRIFLDGVAGFSASSRRPRRSHASTGSF